MNKIETMRATLQGQAELRQEKLARMSTWQRSALVNAVLADHPLAGRKLITGSSLEQRYHRNPDFMVPHPQLRHELLLAGGETIDDLQEYTYGRLERLGKHFSVAKYYDPQGNAPLTDSGMPIENVKNALGIVERSMTGKRRTGEDSIAHIYRVLLRGIDLIQENQRRYNGGAFIPHFTPQTAELLLLLATLHDHVEDGDGQIRLFKNISTKGYSEQTFHVDRLSKGPDKPHEILESTKLNIPQEYWWYFSNALEGLNKGDIEDDAEAVTHLRDRLRDAHVKLDTTELTTAMIPALGPTAKCLDRTDNGVTHSFRYDHDTGTYIPTPVEKTMAKAQQTVEGYASLERVFDMILLERIHPVKKGQSILYKKHLFPPELTKLNDTALAQYYPTRWAVQTLMGLGPNEIFHQSSRKGKHQGLPQMI